MLKNYIFLHYRLNYCHGDNSKKERIQESHMLEHVTLNLSKWQRNVLISDNLDRTDQGFKRKVIMKKYD